MVSSITDPLGNTNSYSTPGDVIVEVADANGTPWYTLMITGTKTIDEMTSTVFTETSPDNPEATRENYLLKDNRGIIYLENNDATDILTLQTAPYRNVLFPLQLNYTFNQINKKGLDVGEDLDRDGKSEKFDIISKVTIVAFEKVTIPVGSFPNSVKIETRTTITLKLSRNKAKFTSTGTQTQWFSPGIGLVKTIVLIKTGRGRSSRTITEELIGFTVNGQGKGIVTEPKIAGEMGMRSRWME